MDLLYFYSHPLSARFLFCTDTHTHTQFCVLVVCDRKSCREEWLQREHL